MVTEIKLNICLILDVDSEFFKKDLENYVKNNLVLKSNSLIDLIEIKIIK